MAKKGFVPFGMGDKGKAPMGGKDDPKATAKKMAAKKKAKKK